MKAIYLASALVLCGAHAVLAQDVGVVPEAAAVTAPAPAQGTAEIAADVPAAPVYKTEWAYGAGPRGPANWAALSPNYGACGSGLQQSPIDITQYYKEDQPDLALFYKPTPIDIYNNGRTLDFVYQKGSGFTVEGKAYKIRQMDFHTPSEHLINGLPSPMELHLVHQADDGAVAIVAVMIKAGAENKYLQAFLQNTPSVKGGRKKIPSVLISAADILPETLDYYRYDGSLTIPPCREGVQWFVLKAAIEASPAQINAFQKLFPGNARPVQNLHERIVRGD